jgi:hypothetical protein
MYAKLRAVEFIRRLSQGPQKQESCMSASREFNLETAPPQARTYN